MPMSDDKSPVREFERMMEIVEHLDLSQIDIAMLAPNRVGKSTLIATMCMSFERLLKQRMGNEVKFSYCQNDNVYEYPNQFVSREEELVEVEATTYEYINCLIQEWRKVAHASGRFAANTCHRLCNRLLSFSLEIEKVKIPFRIFDYYSNQYIESNESLSGEEHLAVGDKALTAYFKNCTALVIPVFSLAIMELYDLDTKHEEGAIDDAEYDVRSRALEKVVDMEHIAPRIVEWCLDRAMTKQHGLLLVVPLKCEKYFAECDSNVKLNLLQNRIKGLLFKAVSNRLLDLKAYESADKRTEIIDSFRNFIRVEYLPVQTFGKSLFVDAKLEWRDGYDIEGNSIRTFIDRYTRRNVGAIAPPVGAVGIVFEVLKYRKELMEAAYRSSVADGQLINELDGTNTRIRGKINGNEEEAARAVNFVRKIAQLNVPIGNLCRWEWDFSEENNTTPVAGEE